MPNSILLLTILTLLSGPTASLSPDGLSLLAFKAAVTSDPTAALSDWNPTDPDPCHWSGISCANISGFSTRRVVAFSASGRNLSGYLPSVLGSLSFLRRLNLHSNNLSGAIPPSLSNATSLHSLFFHSNAFSGDLPATLCSLPRLQNLDVSSNSLSGHLPETLKTCRNLQRLYLRHNRFSGQIPPDIWPELQNLIELDLSDNDFSGPIPEEMGMMKGLTGTLNLSHNRLSGEIPESLGKLPAVVGMDLRSNDFSGEIPGGSVTGNQGAVGFLGNPRLCGFPLPVACERRREGGRGEGRGGGGRSGPADGGRRRLSKAAIALISVADAAGVVIVGLVLVYVYWKMKEKDGKGCSCRKTSKLGSPRADSNCCLLCCTTRSDSSSPSTPPSPSPADDSSRLVALDKGLSLELDELLRSSAYVLGKSGAGGIVYKVVLGNGMAVAVRRLGEGGGMGRYGEFAAEVAAIGRVKHPNIVRVRAYYWSRDEKLLISDYVPNGNLASALRAKPGQPGLPWAARLRIAKGMANGLAHLHDCSPRKFVHGDIKPTNVLLDEKLNPKVSDFGLPRLLSLVGDGANFSGTIMGGSLPYVKSKSAQLDRPNNYRAPEARLPVGRPTQKWDIYSFGVVLLELLTGRSPEYNATSPTSTSSSPVEAGELVRWVRKGFSVERSLSEMVDVALLQESLTKKSVISVFRIALACTETDPDSRPRMKQVYDDLENIST